MTAIPKPKESLWDYESYAALPFDGKRHEIIEGEHYVNPAPNLYHQEVSRHIQFQLYTQIDLQELGKVMDAPVDLQLSEHDIVQPDLVIVTKQRKHILTPTYNISRASQVLQGFEADISRFLPCVFWTAWHH